MRVGTRPPRARPRASKALLDGDRFGQVARLIDVQAAQARDLVGEQLERDDRERRVWGGTTASGAWSSGLVRGMKMTSSAWCWMSSFPSVAIAMTLAPRARVSWMFETTLS